MRYDRVVNSKLIPFVDGRHGRRVLRELLNHAFADERADDSSQICSPYLPYRPIPWSDLDYLNDPPSIATLAITGHNQEVNTRVLCDF